MTRVTDVVEPIEPSTLSLFDDSFPANTTAGTPDEVFVIPPVAVVPAPPPVPLFVHDVLLAV